MTTREVGELRPEGRNSRENRHAVTGDRLQHRPDIRERRAEHDGRTEPQRTEKAVPKTERGKETGNAEAAVTRPELEHLGRVGLDAGPEVAVRVHRAFRPPGAARGIHEVAEIPLVHGHRRAGGAVVEPRRIEDAPGAGQDGCLIARHDGRWFAIDENLVSPMLRSQGIDRHRDRSERRDTEERGEPVETVPECDDDSLTTPHACPREGAVRPLGRVP